MLTGFEKETQPLTDAELTRYLPILVIVLKYHIGCSAAIKAHEILTKLKSYGCELNEVRLRKLVNHIRTHNIIPGYVLISTSKGYWLSNDAEEIRVCAKSLKDRGAAIMHVGQAIEKFLQQIKNAA